MAIEGGCRCERVRYRLDVEEMPPVYCCHCLFCQTWTGSAFSQQAVLGSDAFSVTAGQPETFTKTNLNGSLSTQHVCGECHTRLWNENSSRPGIVLVRAGTLDDSSGLIPRAHIWTKRKQPWITLDPDIPAWPENAPAGEFIAALNKE